MRQRLRPKGYQIAQKVGIALSIALVIVLVWAAAASAQTPADVQYGERKAPSGPALASGGVSVGETSTTNGAASKTGEAKSSSGKLTRLPATGGPMLMVYVGALAACGAGIVLLRILGRDS